MLPLRTSELTVSAAAAPLLFPSSPCSGILIYQLLGARAESSFVKDWGARAVAALPPTDAAAPATAAAHVSNPLSADRGPIDPDPPCTLLSALLFRTQASALPLKTPPSGKTS